MKKMIFAVNLITWITSAYAGDSEGKSALEVPFLQAVSALSLAEPQPQTEKKGLEAGAAQQEKATREAALENLKNCQSILGIFGKVVDLIQPISENPQDPNSIGQDKFVFKFLAPVGPCMTQSGEVSILSRLGYRQWVIKPEWGTLIDAVRKELNVLLLSQLKKAICSDKYDHLNLATKNDVANLLGQMNRNLGDVISTIKRLKTLLPVSTSSKEYLAPDESYSYMKAGYNYDRNPIFIQFILDYLNGKRFYIENWDKLEYAFKRPLIADIKTINSAASRALALFPKE